MVYIPTPTHTATTKPRARVFLGPETLTWFPAATRASEWESGSSDEAASRADSAQARATPGALWVVLSASQWASEAS